MKELTRLEDDSTLDTKTRIGRVFKALYNSVVAVKGLCSCEIYIYYDYGLCSLCLYFYVFNFIKTLY